MLEDAFETVNENIGNIEYVNVNDGIATVYLKEALQIAYTKIYIYGVPTYLTIYNSSTSKFQNVTNIGNLNSVNGAGKFVLSDPQQQISRFRITLVQRF